jgi:hypothetical protein
LSKPLVEALQKLEDQMVAMNIYFGIGFLVLAVIIFLLLRWRRPRKAVSQSEEPMLPPRLADELSNQPPTPQPTPFPQPQPPVLTPRPGAPGLPPQGPQPRPRKKPRLIQ